MVYVVILGFVKLLNRIVKFWAEFTTVFRTALKVVELNTVHDEATVVKEQEAPEVDIPLGTIRRTKELETRGLIDTNEIVYVVWVFIPRLATWILV